MTDMKTLNNNTKIALNRLRIVPVGNGSVDKQSKIIFLTELANLGYKVSNPDAFNDSVLHNFDQTISVLTEMKGGDVSYVPLFNGFPNEVPEKNEFFAKRVLGFMGNIIGLFDENDGEVMDNGLVVPNWLFDINEFSADPILGRQSLELFEKGKEAQDARMSDTHSELITLELVSEDEIDDRLKTYLCNNLYAKSSIKEALKEDIEYLINTYGLSFVDPSKVVFKETKSYIMTKLWNDKRYKKLRGYISTPTDILRMFAGITDSDISLSEKIRFPKMNRPQRRFVLECLDKFQSGDLPENLYTYKGLWLSLGRYIHPGEYKNAYPFAYEAFNALRNGKVHTFNSRVERAIVSKDMSTAIELLSTRPGVFGRKLHELLNVFTKDSERAAVLDAFKNVATELELKNLLVMETYFNTINDSDNRTVINKKGKVIVLPNDSKGSLDPKTSVTLDGIIKKAITSKLNNTNDLSDKNVWIDPELANYTVPLQQRKMSDGLLSIGRGSRIKFDDQKVLRMFTYWRESSTRTDLDLSLVEFDEEMNFKGQVSYTNLSEKGIVHSGDITSAPYGAAEFIDVDLSSLKEGVRYIGIQIYRFSGEKFSDLAQSYAGWMFRDKVDRNYKSFDIKTVANKFNVTGSGNYAIPIIVDVLNKEIIYIDMYMSGRDSRYNSNEGAITDVAIVTKELVNMVNTRPNMYDLITYQMVGSKANLVETKEEADLTYGITDCDTNVNQVDEILSELL